MFKHICNLFQTDIFSSAFTLYLMRLCLAQAISLHTTKLLQFKILMVFPFETNNTTSHFCPENVQSDFNCETSHTAMSLSVNKICIM